jgi:AraC-like DNA-binding protein
MPRGAPTAFSYALGLAVMTAAVETGRPPPEVCAALGLSPDQVKDPLGRLPHTELARVWNTLDAQIDGFGFRAARLARALPQSLAEYAISNATTAADAIRLFIRFQAMFHDAADHSLAVGADRCVLRLALAPPLRLPDGIGDFLAATQTIKTQRWVDGVGPPLLVRLTRPSLPASSLAAELFRCPIEVGCAAVEVVWPRSVLDRPLIAADPGLFTLLSRQIEAALGLPASGAGLPVMSAEQGDPVLAVKRHLATALPSGRFSIQDAAEALATTPRSLQRRLAEQGQRYQEILDGSRRELALALLSGDKNLAEAALATGFSDLPAFVRAFRRWTGTTPASWVTGRVAHAGPQRSPPA